MQEKEQMNGIILQICCSPNAGAIIKTLDEKPFLYGKADYRNPSLLIKRAENLDI